MNNILFKAILSMDSYNRGYGAAIELPDSDTAGTQIGNARIVKNKGDDAAKFIGFYALAYDTNGDDKADVIAYRGTDARPANFGSHVNRLYRGD